MHRLYWIFNKVDLLRQRTLGTEKTETRNPLTHLLGSKKEVKGTEKTHRPLCHRPLTTASSRSRDDFFRLLKRCISYLYVCMHMCMHAPTYLFNSVQRTFSEEDWSLGHLPQAGCAEACWVGSWYHNLLQISFPERQSGPFVL